MEACSDFRRRCSNLFHLAHAAYSNSKFELVYRVLEEREAHYPPIDATSASDSFFRTLRLRSHDDSYCQRPSILYFSRTYRRPRSLATRLQYGPAPTVRLFESELRSLA